MKQRALSVLLSLLLLASFCFVAVAETTEFKMAYETTATDLKKGDIFEISFLLVDIQKSNGLLTLEAKVEFDNTHLKLLGSEAIYPASWNDEMFFVPTETTSGTKNTLSTLLVWDGMEFKPEHPVVADKTMGIKLKFSVETASDVSTEIKVLDDGLVGASSLPDVVAVYGEGVTCKLNLNYDPNKEQSEESNGEVSAPVGDTTSEPESSVELSSADSSLESEDPSEESSIEGNVSVEASSSAGEETSVASKEETEESLSSVEASSEKTDESILSSTVESNVSQGDDEGGLGIIFWIIIVCAVVAVMAVVVYIVKNKKDDMNPVNPG